MKKARVFKGNQKVDQEYELNEDGPLERRTIDEACRGVTRTGDEGRKRVIQVQSCKWVCTWWLGHGQSVSYSPPHSSAFLFFFCLNMSLESMRLDEW